MRCNAPGSARDLIFSLLAMLATGAVAAVAETQGRATIGPPTTSTPIDPFTGGPVPTPFVPYASQGTDLDPALRGLNVAAPPSSPTPQPSAASAPVPQPIGGGDLVPVTIPSAAKPEPPKQPVAAKTEPLTPIRSAVMTKSSPTTTAAKEKKPKKPASVETAPSATPKPVERETARPPVRFSFPQPIIPLESALRKWFGRSPNRG